MGENMTKKNMSSNSKSRRKFFKAAAATVVGGSLLAACDSGNKKTEGSSTQQKSVKLTMQAVWPSGANIFFEMAQDYCNMVKDMSGGSLTIDLKPVGAVVKTSEIGQAVSSGVVDMGHWVTAYWYGKNAAASLFGTGPSYGMSSQEVMGWMEYG
jgi:TRAP-type mannitol/chloroaromatic compound transport system substrate-binding protein